jgi:hypothetical protein
VSVREATDALSLSTAQVYELAAPGTLEKRYIGKGTRNFRLTAESLRAYAESLPTEPRN